MILCQKVSMDNLELQTEAGPKLGGGVLGDKKPRGPIVPPRRGTEKSKRGCGGVKKRAWWESRTSVCKACCLEIRTKPPLAPGRDLAWALTYVLLCGSLRTEGLWRSRVGLPLQPAHTPPCFLLLTGGHWVFFPREGALLWEKESRGDRGGAGDVR